VRSWLRVQAEKRNRSAVTTKGTQVPRDSIRLSRPSATKSFGLHPAKNEGAGYGDVAKGDP
jgi:hypothetical protein